MIDDMPTGIMFRAGGRWNIKMTEYAPTDSDISWEKVSSYAQNHMFDVETNSALATKMLGI